MVQRERYSYSPISSDAGGGHYWDTTGEALVLSLGEDRYFFELISETIAVRNTYDTGRLANWRNSIFGFFHAFLGLKVFKKGGVPIGKISLRLILDFIRRSERIRTSDPCLPKTGAESQVIDFSSKEPCFFGVISNQTSQVQVRQVH
ncbi:hypothetical protein [Ruegeria sp. SCP11]|uniref:hypothetical protein n=1 Tax=Ruegeria sp. SCP11 TaxID=3141378 RepID=UPI00333D95D7